jgi:transposase
MFSDKHWEKLKPILLQSGVYDKPNLRNIIEGIFYRLRTGCPWRDLPLFFGSWNSIYKRFNDWSEKGKLIIIFKQLTNDPDYEWIFIDGTIVKAHQHSSGVADIQDSAIGKSVSGFTTKIHMVVDSFGLPIEFEITGGQVHDSKMATKLISKLPDYGSIIADRGYDSDPLREQISRKGLIPIIPRKKNSKIGNYDIDWCLYKYRHLVENIFARLKHFRSIATRYDKLKRNFEGMLTLACAYIWLPF